LKSGWERIMTDLGSREVTVIDLTARFAESAENPFCLRDSHWSGQGIALASAEILPLLEHSGMDVEGPSAAQSRWTSQTITGDLGGDPEEVRLQFRTIEADPAAAKLHPLLLLGDSHLLVFHTGGALHAAGAGLPDQLAAAVGAMPDVIGVMGSGATSSRVALARRIRADASYLPAKKVVVWCFAGREFTEADSWKKIPLQRPAP
jgi:alginate O-acetyltransferase complex protein AlgJ